MIWIIGGTSNAIEIARILQTLRYKHLVTVTTGFGQSIAALEGSNVRTGALSADEMLQLIDEQQIAMVLDASHPYAAEVSGLAMEACRQKGVEYVRYERPYNVHPEALYFDSYEDIVSYLKDTNGAVFITTGSKFCDKYIPLGVERLYLRVLDTPESINLTRKAGFPESHVVTMRAIVSEEDNRVVMKSLQIRYLITKDSGNDGGVEQKIRAAKSVGAKVLILKRPALNYPQVCTSYTALIQYLTHNYKFRHCNE